ncbi:hypothetical protein DV738_g3010, partial [Chaetothyriales sp. CBS 135597]
MSRIVQVLIPAAIGVGLVVYGMNVASYPLGEETQQQCLTDRKGPYFTEYGDRLGLGPTIDGTMCTLFAMFNSIARTLVGKALGTIFASVLFPAMAVALLATTLGFSLFLGLLMSLPTFVVTTSNPNWIWANIFFHIFPLALVPVLFATGPAKDSQTAQNKLPYTNLLRGLGWAAGLLWWMGIMQALLDYNLPAIDEGKELSHNLISPLFLSGMGLPALPPRLRPSLAAEFNEGARFLLFDMLAVISTLVASVAIHSSSPKGISASFSLSRFIVLLLVGGPGLAFSFYWAEVYRLDQYRRWFHITDEQDQDGAAEAQREQRKENAAAIADEYAFLSNWSPSFHYTPFSPQHQTLREAQTFYQHRLAVFLKLQPTDLVLDVGCGVGGPALEIARLVGCTVVGVSINQRQIDIARAEARRQGLGDGDGDDHDHDNTNSGCTRGHCTFVRADFSHLPFPDNTFDAAFAIEATCHAANLTAVYREIARVHVRVRERIERGNGVASLPTSTQAHDAFRAAGSPGRGIARSTGRFRF